MSKSGNDTVFRKLATEYSKDCLIRCFQCPLCVMQKEKRNELVNHLIQVHKTDMLESKIKNIKENFEKANEITDD